MPTISPGKGGRPVPSRTPLAILGAAAVFTAYAVLPAAAAARPELQPAARPAALAVAPATLDPALLQRTLDAMVAAGAPAALAHVRDGAKTWSGAAGVRSLSSRQPARPNDRFRAGSIMKTMVAAVVLQLVDEGKVALTDDVRKLLPGLLPYAEAVTVRQLLDHTSGLPNHVGALFAPSGEKYVADVQRHRYSTYSPAELVRIATRRPLVHKPGTAWAYSNTNYVMAGLLVEKITGRSLTAELQKRIFAPAGMTATSVPKTSPVIPGPHLRGYVLRPGRPHLDATVYHPSVWWAAGSVVSTNADLNRFFRALSDGTLLPPARLAEMRTPGVPGAGGYALGLMGTAVGAGCETVPGGVLWGNKGNVFGYRTESWTSADGNRQVSISYTLDDTYNRPAPPAFTAPIGRFLTAALCDLDLGTTPPAQANP